MKNGNGKETGKNAFLSFLVPLNFDTFFPFWRILLKTGDERGGTVEKRQERSGKRLRSYSWPFQILESSEIPFLYSSKPVSTPFQPRS